MNLPNFVLHPHLMSYTSSSLVAVRSYKTSSERGVAADSQTHWDRQQPLARLKKLILPYRRDSWTNLCPSSFLFSSASMHTRALLSYYFSKGVNLRHLFHQRGSLSIVMQYGASLQWVDTAGSVPTKARPDWSYCSIFPFASVRVAPMLYLPKRGSTYIRCE